MVEGWGWWKNDGGGEGMGNGGRISGWRKDEVGGGRRRGGGVEG